MDSEAREDTDMKELYEEACFDYTNTPTWYYFGKCMLYMFLWAISWPVCLIYGERQ